MNHLWLFGAVVLLWHTGPGLDDGGAKEWYTPALLDRVTHVDVNATSAVQLKQSMNKGSDLPALVENARAVADEILSPDAMGRYVFDLVGALRAKLDFDRLSRRDLQALFGAACSTLDLDLVEITGSGTNLGLGRGRRGGRPEVAVSSFAKGHKACDALLALAKAP